MSIAPSQLPAQVLQALQDGDKIEAIKRLREITGCGLKEAKDAVEGLDQPSGRRAQAKQDLDPDAPLSVAVVAALQQGNKIEAIRQLRVQRGIGLKDAKDAIDAHLREHAGKYPQMALATASFRRSATKWLLLGAGAVVAFLIWRELQ